MKTLAILGAVILILVVIPGCWAIGTYNGLQREVVAVDAGWAQVENVYQRRADLVPNLVETVKGYAAHEKGAFQAVVEARAKATSVTVNLQNAEDLKRFQAAQGELSSALSRLLAVSEAYPDLKANQNFLALQSQLEGTENRISVERMRFNEAVQAYNGHLRVFPANVIAGMAGLQPRAFFEAAPEAREAPKVRF